MKIAELRKKSKDELQQELDELLREQFNLRMQKANFGQPGAIKSHQIKDVRRQIARIKTLLHQGVSHE